MSDDEYEHRLRRLRSFIALVRPKYRRLADVARCLRDEYDEHLEGTIIKLYREDWPIEKIAHAIGFSPNAIVKSLRQSGVPIRKQGVVLHRRKISMDAEIVALYQSGISMHAIARLAGISNRTVSVTLKRLGVTPRDQPPPQSRLRDERLRSVIAEYEAGATLRDLSKRYGYSMSMIGKQLKAHGCKMRERRRISHLTEEQLRSAIKEYESGATLRDVATRYGYASYDVLSKQFKARGVRLRSSGGAVRPPRLSGGQLHNAIAEYEAGASLRDLARRYGYVNHMAFGRQLKAHGCVMRRRKP